MKKFLKYLTLVIVSLFIFNVGIVYAEENTEESTTETQVTEVEEENKSSENNEQTFTTNDDAPPVVVGTSNEEEQQQQEELVEEVEESEEVEVPEEQEVSAAVETPVVETTPETVVPETPVVAVTATDDPEPDEEDEGGSSGTMELPVQKVTVFIKKVDPEGNYISGCVLQILDSNGEVVKEFTSGNEAYEIMLPSGTYTLHEVSVPEMYDIADDKEFTVTVVAEIGYNAHTYEPNIPCETATTYTVEYEGKVYEVYCINQLLTEPGDGADYDGTILTPDTIRAYTQQQVLETPNYNPGGEGAVSNHGTLTSGPIDVSDTTLNNEQLYNMILDIVYRRTQARNQERFQDEDALPDEAISFLTEMALKMYTNAGVTQIQRWSSLQPGDDALYVKEGKYYWYLMHMYRDYVYDPDSPNGYRVDIGHGDSLGNFARHWTNDKPLHESRNLSVDHPIYAEFYYYLLGDTVSSSMTHPDDMYIYIYHAANNDEHDKKYQNLIGITGYLEDFHQEQEVVMTNNYKTTDITVNKVWNDKENYNNKRPQSVKVSLYANNKLVESVTLNEEDNWEYNWESMALYENGIEIKYAIKEDKVPGYSTVIEGSAKVGFTVINSYDNPPRENPHTADNLIVYVLLLLISVSGMIKCSYKLIKNN